MGSIPGIWIGSHFSARMPGPALRGALAIVLTASGVALSSKAGWGPSLISFVACAAAERGGRGRRRSAAIPPGRYRPGPVSERA